MLMVNLFQWWYSQGWADFARRIKDRLSNSVDYFSMGSLLRTLFSPFRQIDAGGNGIQAFFSRLFSRFIGAGIRLVILFAGLIVLLLETILGFVSLIIWPLVPMLPVVGIILTIIQVRF